MSDRDRLAALLHEAWCLDGLEPYADTACSTNRNCVVVADRLLAAGVTFASPVKAEPPDLAALRGALESGDEPITALLRRYADRVAWPHSGWDPAPPIREWADRIDAALAASPPPAKPDADCKHPNAVSARNEVVAAGLYCPDCRSVFPEDEPPAKPDAERLDVARLARALVWRRYGIRVEDANPADADDAAVIAAEYARLRQPPAQDIDAEYPALVAGAPRAADLLANVREDTRS